MPTEPLLGVLDREYSIADAQQFTDVACSLLREVINYGTRAWRRCEAAPDDRGGPDEHLGLLTMYRQMIEMADGIEVLLRHSCALASVPLARSLYEAKLGILFLTREPSTKRALAWVVAFAHQQLEVYRSIGEGGSMSGAWERQFGQPPQMLPDPGRSIARLESLLCQPHIVAIQAEYEGRRKRRSRPPWYSLYDGPADLRELARRLNREAEYLGYYRFWSRLVHANDFSSFTTAQPGQGLIWLYARFPGQLQQLSTFTVASLIEATQAMLEHLRPGESWQEWYRAEVRDAFLKLSHMRIDVRVVKG